MDVQRAGRKAQMGATKHNEEFDAMKRHGQWNRTPYRAKSNRRETLINCKYTTAEKMPRKWQEMLKM